MKDDLDLILSVSKKLGWGDMDVAVAIPAIRTIINNFAWIVASRHDHQVTKEDVEEALLKNYTSDDVFGLLGFDDDPNYPGSENERLFISLRGEIEDMMFMGLNFVEAIREWYK